MPLLCSILATFALVAMKQTPAAPPPIQLSSIDRVPVYGSNPTGTNAREVHVHIPPGAIAEGDYVTAWIRTTRGRGDASFENGLDYQNITSSTTLRIFGSENSDEADNIELLITDGRRIRASTRFTVSTWPVDFQQKTGRLHEDFGLSVILSWESESGALCDLSNVKFREYVMTTHSGANPPFRASGPPVYAWPPEGLPGTDGGGFDVHRYPEECVDSSVREEAMQRAKQFYQFQDHVLGSDWWTVESCVRERHYVPLEDGGYLFRTVKYGRNSNYYEVVEERR
jgi:hypothetical protein